MFCNDIAQTESHQGSYTHNDFYCGAPENKVDVHDFKYSSGMEPDIVSLYFIVVVVFLAKVR